MELQTIMDCIGRTRMVSEMDRNRVRRSAKLTALELLEIDIKATARHLEILASEKVKK